MRGRTLYVDLCSGQARATADNRATILPCSEVQALASPPRLLFFRYYEAIRAAAEQHRDQGVLLLALESRGLAASAALTAHPGRITTATIGRHNAVDLYLDADPQLSLRHLLLIAHPLTADGVRYRLVDLRSTSGFFDEQGRRLASIEAEGPAFVRCGRYWLLLLVSGDDPGPWPDDPESAWDCIPERVYFEDVAAEPDRHQRARTDDPPRPAPGQRPRTLIRTSDGPSVGCDRMLATGEDPVGALWISGDRGSIRLLLGRRALQRGVLLGRADRCDGVRTPFSHLKLSRVHLLVIEINETIYVIDTASTHGTRLQGEPLRAARLPLDARLELAHGALHACWCPIN
jgi:hypothetical protein